MEICTDKGGEKTKPIQSQFHYPQQMIGKKRSLPGACIGSKAAKKCSYFQQSVNMDLF
jgi:hypothetical protein